MEEAERLSRILLEQRLCACANLVADVRSVFRWDGQTQTDDEILLIAKNTLDALGAFKRVFAANHSYDVPEIVALPVVGGNDTYLDWVRAEVAAREAPDRYTA